MYRKEKVIDGVLHCQNVPDGAWNVVSAKYMTMKITQLQEQLESVSQKEALPIWMRKPTKHRSDD